MWGFSVMSMPQAGNDTPDDIDCLVFDCGYDLALVFYYLPDQDVFLQIKN